MAETPQIFGRIPLVPIVFPRNGVGRGGAPWTQHEIQRSIDACWSCTNTQRFSRVEALLILSADPAMKSSLKLRTSPKAGGYFVDLKDPIVKLSSDVVLT